MNEGYQNLRQRRVVHRATDPAPASESPNPEENAEGQSQIKDAVRQSQIKDAMRKDTAHPDALETEKGPDSWCPVEIVAELSANHKQDLDLAFQTLRSMAKSGATAVKLQSYDAQSLTLPIDKAPFVIGGESGTATPTPTPWDGRSLYALYEEAAMPWEWHQSLYKLAGQLGLEIFSTPFCLRGVDFLEQLDTPRYKIASFEIGHLELVRKLAATGKPLIASLGIASFAEIERFLEVCHSEANDNITLLQCTSAYPASPADANLAMIPHLKSTFGCRVGLSDHTDHTWGSAVAVAAVALGAELIEKHFILSRELGGPDASFSVEPQEFAALVRDVHTAAQAIGKVDYRKKDRRFGRAIFTLRDLRSGERLQREDLGVLRPFPEGRALGIIGPHHLEEILGTMLCRDISYGTALRWNMLDSSEDGLEGTC